MTDRWGYIVALPLCDYYNEEIWWRVFPPSEDDGMLTGFWLDGYWIPVEVNPDAKWIELKDHLTCPDCERAARELFTHVMRQAMTLKGEEMYRAGLADAENHPPEDK